MDKRTTPTQQGEPTVVIIGGAASLTAQVIEALAEAGHHGPVIACDELPHGLPEQRDIVETYVIDEIVERMKIPTAYYLPPRERHHPVSPKQRGGR